MWTSSHRQLSFAAAVVAAAAVHGCALAFLAYAASSWQRAPEIAPDASYDVFIWPSLADSVVYGSPVSISGVHLIWRQRSACGRRKPTDRFDLCALAYSLAYAAHRRPLALKIASTP